MSIQSYPGRDSSRMKSFKTCKLELKVIAIRLNNSDFSQVNYFRVI